MSKTGPKRQERFRKRWFSLVGTTIWYYAQPLDAHPINYIPLGSKSYGYGVKKGVPQGVKVEGKLLKFFLVLAKQLLTLADACK